MTSGIYNQNCKVKMDSSVTQHSENINRIMLTRYVNNEYDVDTISIVIISGIL